MKLNTNSTLRVLKADSNDDRRQLIHLPLKLLKGLRKALGYLEIHDTSTSFSYRTNSRVSKVRGAKVGMVIGMDRGHPRGDITSESKLAIYDILRYIHYIIASE